jgi:NAD(P)-dependent dehydrogenase (short-subunit alcohol dehydrogenase family)
MAAQDESLAVVHQGALLGMARSLSHEWPNASVRTVDVERTEHGDAIAARLLTEIAATDTAMSIAYRGGERWQLLVREAPLHTHANARQATELSLDANTVVLITGGARGITAEIAVLLAKRYRPTLVLTGRSPFPEEPEPAELANLTSAQQLKAALIARLRAANETVSVARVESAVTRILQDREMRANVARMRAAGATVRYVAVDACDERAMRSLLAELGPVDVVVHGAGIIKDRLLEDKTPESFDQVFDTKADSAWVLASALDPAQVKALVFFSSVAAAYGNRGQVDYAAANSLLNHLAITLDRIWPGRVTALGWGPWEGTGMLSAELRRQFAERGVPLVPVEVGCRAFVRELTKPAPGEAAVVLAGGTWESPRRTDIRQSTRQEANLIASLSGSPLAVEVSQ